MSGICSGNSFIGRFTIGVPANALVPTRCTRPFSNSKTCNAPGSSIMPFIYSVISISGVIMKSIGIAERENNSGLTRYSVVRIRAIILSTW